MKNLDLIIPLYKSGDYLPELIARIEFWTKITSVKVKVIFVDDGSQDGTFEKLLTLVNTVSFEHLELQLATNYGQHTATAVGFHHSDASLVATIDDDLQHDPFQLELLIEKLKTEDVSLVYGNYDSKKHHFFRNLGSKLLKTILQTSGHDYSAVTSFRVMKSSTISAFKQKHFSVLFVDEYLMRYASKISICTVKHDERTSGSSTYSGGKLFKLAIAILLFHSSIPLKLITRFGILMSLIFFIFGCYFIYNKMFHAVQLGYTSLIVAIFFSTGMMMLSLGIIGEYIRKIWISQHQLDKVIVLDKK